MDYAGLTLALKDSTVFHSSLPSSYWEYALTKFETSYLSPFAEYWTDYWPVGTFLNNLQARMGSQWLFLEVQPYLHFLLETLPGCEAS